MSVPRGGLIGDFPRPPAKRVNVSGHRERPKAARERR
jgi:hypothetical protein